MDILNGNIKKIFYKLLVIAFGGSFITCIFGIIDAMAVGLYHGESGTAALPIFMPVWTIMYGLGFLIGVGGSVLFSKYKKEDIQKANEYFTLVIIMSFVISLLVILLLVFFQDPLFIFFGADEELLILVKKYLKGVIFGLPCCIYVTVLGAFLRNDGSPLLATVAVLIGGLFNLFGDYFFVFGLDKGIMGAGIATEGSLIISTLIMFLHFKKKNNSLRLVKIRNIFPKMKKIIILGFPSAINDMSMGILAIFINRQIMIYLGKDSLAVYGIITQITAFVQCCAYSVGNASQPIISENLTFKKNERVLTTLKHSLITSFLLGIFWILIMTTCYKLLVNMFLTPSLDFLILSKKIMFIYGFSYLFLIINIYATYYFQSIIKPNAALIISLARGFILPSLLVLILPIFFHPYSIFFALIISELIVTIYALIKISKSKKEILS